MEPHYLTNWIPEKYKSEFKIVHTFESHDPALDQKTIWVEHGAPDRWIKKLLIQDPENEKYREVYFLCMTSWSYRILIDSGYKAFYTGSIFQDETRPEKLGGNGNTLIYVPIHTSSNNILIPVEELEYLSQQYGCDGFITSAIEDTDIGGMDPRYNIMFSDRRNAEEHFLKCKFLYSKAKLIYSDCYGTFDITAESFGIPVHRRVYAGEIFKKGEIIVPSDRNCKNRVLEILERIYQNVI